MNKMKSKMMLVAMLLVLGAVAIPLVPVYAPPTPLTLSDDELLTQFFYEWGPGTITITDIAGPGVKFTGTGLSTSSGTGYGDDFAVSVKAGGAYKDYGGYTGYGDFTGYTSYEMYVTNNGPNVVTVCLKMNTGFTDPPWGIPSDDTYWQSPWTSIAVGQTKLIKLDFTSAEAWNIADDTVYTGLTDGNSYAVTRLDEVSDIGIQVLGDGNAELLVGDGPPFPEFVIPELPLGTITALITMASALLLFKKKPIITI